MKFVPVTLVYSIRSNAKPSTSASVHESVAVPVTRPSSTVVPGAVQVSAGNASAGALPPGRAAEDPARDELVLCRRQLWLGQRWLTSLNDHPLEHEALNLEHALIRGLARGIWIGSVVLEHAEVGEGRRDGLPRMALAAVADEDRPDVSPYVARRSDIVRGGRERICGDAGRVVTRGERDDGIRCERAVEPSQNCTALVAAIGAGVWSTESVT